MIRRLSPRLAQRVTLQQMNAVVHEKLRNAPAVDKTLIVDVRSTAEVQSTGMIPTAVNIPVGLVQQVLGVEVDEEDFEDAFGVAKPKPDTHRLIFYCHHGVRSEAAAEMAEALGFRAVGNYDGSWAEWAAKGDQP